MNQMMEVRILEGASALFYKYGFNRVRFSEIAREVGITTRTIYNYFPNKLSLSKAVSSYTFKKIMAEMENLAKSDAAYPEQVVMMLKHVYKELKKRLPVYQKDSAFSGTGFPGHFNLDSDLGDFVIQYTERAADEGYIEREAPVEMMFQILLNQINFCFPLDGAHTSETVSEDYFLKSTTLIIQSCLTEKGKNEFSRLVN